MVPMAVAWAADPLRLDLFADTRYSDNINKNEQNPQEEFVHRVGIGFDKATDPGTCEADLGGDVAFRHYQRDTNSDDVTGSLDLNGNCQPNPWFRWSARNTLREIRSNTAAPDSPANRERRNVFSTGPTFIWPVSARDSLSLDLRYQMTRFEEATQDDSDRVTATTQWQRIWTQRLSGGLAASRSEIDMRRTEEELTQENVNVFFNYRFPNGVLSGQFGKSWLTTEFGPFEQKTDALTGNLRYDHDWGGGTSTYITAGRRLTDASTDIDIEIQGLEFTLTETTGVQVTNVGTGINHRWTGRTSSSLDLSYAESDFQASGTREERYTASGSVNHRLSETLDGTWRAGATREDFGAGNIWVNTYRSSLGLNYQRTRDLSLNASLGLETRNIEGGPGNQYDEHWIQAGLRYNLR